MRLEFAADEQKKMLYGPFLIPNKLIYRNDDKNGEYYVRFSAGEIKKIAEKFNEQLKNKNINFMHTDEDVNAFVFENWVVEDAESDKSKKFGFDLPEGTWFGGVKIKDEKFWNEEVKSENVKGFSVEILANLELKMNKKININMKRKQKVDLGQTMLGDGSTPIYYSGDVIEVGTKIFTDEAMTMVAKDDRWVLEDGRIIVVVDGAVTAIEDQTLMSAEELTPDGDQTEAKMQSCVKAQMARYGNEEAAMKACQKIMGSTKKENMQTDIPGTPMAQSLTAEEVSLMIDSRYQELMDEITALKSMMGDKEKEYQDYKKQIEQKFSITPAEKSIKKTTTSENKPKDRFTEMENRVRQFAKIK